MVFRLKILLAVVLVASPVYADSLVMFKNGKAMRVKSVTKDGQWLKCEFEDKNFIAVPASGVLKVEAAEPGGTAGELRANQVAAGTGGGYVPPPRDGAIQNEAPVEDDPSTGIAEEQAAVAQQPAALIRGSAGDRRNNFRGIPIPPGTNPGVQQGLQPLNQANSPFQSRRLNEQRGSNRNRVPNSTNQPQSAPDE